MTLRERIQSDLTAAMRSGDSLRRDVLRMAESALYNVEKAKRQPLTEDELRSMVIAAIDESGATSARDLGRVMGILAPRTRGRAEGRVVSGLVAQELARRDVAAHERADHGPQR